MKFSSFLTAIGLALLLSPAPVRADVSSLELPDFGDPSGSVVSPQMEQRIGEIFLRHVRKQATIVEDPEVQSYIESLGQRLVSNSDASGASFTFFVVKDPMINAFAAPGGIIGINSGVITNARTEDELAGVLAHEIAHVTQRHMARMFAMQERLSMPMLAAMIGSILLGIANPQAGTAAMTAVAGAQAQHGINFTRANEEEADRVGMQILARADFEPGAMADFFERLQQTSRYYQGNAPEYLRTHPLTASRIAEARARAASYPDKNGKPSESFRLIRAKLMARTARTERAAVETLRAALEQAGPEEAERIAARYGYAIALIDAGEFEAAREQVKRLLDRDPDKPAFMLLAAELERTQRNYDAALQIYERMDQLYPDYRPLVLEWAQTLLDAGKPREARGLLRRYARSNPTDYRYYQLMTQAEGQAGNPVEAGIAEAEYFYLIGDTGLAIERLQHTQRQPGLDYYQQQRISARLEHYKQEFELEQELKL